MFKKLAQTLQLVFCGILIVQLTGCGTLLYPERRGQKAGHVDVGVALLDGLGLLFFLVPGIIAFAVDFSNGTIYLPGTALSSLDVKTIRQVRFDPKKATPSMIEKIVREETGHAVTWDQPDMQISRLLSTSDMLAQFAQVLPETRDDRIALNRVKGDLP